MELGLESEQRLGLGLGLGLGLADDNLHLRGAVLGRHLRHGWRWRWRLGVLVLVGIARLNVVVCGHWDRRGRARIAPPLAFVRCAGRAPRGGRRRAVLFPALLPPASLVTRVAVCAPRRRLGRLGSCQRRTRCGHRRVEAHDDVVYLHRARGTRYGRVVVARARFESLQGRVLVCGGYLDLRQLLSNDRGDILCVRARIAAEDVVPFTTLLQHGNGGHRHRLSSL